MFKPIRRATFLRDFLQIQLGFFLFGVSIALLIRANLGTSAWAVLEVALSNLTKLTPGTLSVIVGFVVLLVGVSLREPIGWGTLANIIFIGPWEDLALWLIPSVKNNLPVQIPMLLGAIALMGLASAVYIGVDAGAGPRDSLMLAVRRKTRWSIRLARGALEIGVVALGWLLGGPAGIGTLVFAILIGYAVQWWFKLLKVEPHREVDAETEDG
jgi:uncharacterized membrane protein YczE